MFENAFLRFIASIYDKIIYVGSNLQSLFLLWMRITWGHQFFLSGLNKVHNIDRTIQFFTSLNISHPTLHAYLVGYLELICGFLLLIGFASRLAALPLIIIMFAALGLAHVDVFTQYRFVLQPSSFAMIAPYPFLITALLVFIFGPGRISIDACLKRWADRQPKY